MELLILFAGLFLSIFSTIVMSYVSMATPIGPWIAPTLVLVNSIIMSFFSRTVSKDRACFPIIMGSIGGIVATACGFSFPTLYFAQQELFSTWLERPIYFCSILFFLSFFSGAIGLWLAHVFASRFIDNNEYPFPIAQFVNKMIEAPDRAQQSKRLGFGTVVSILFGLLQERIGPLSPLLPRSIPILSERMIGVIKIPFIRFDMTLLPVFFAVGFVTGEVIMIPLFVGMMANIFLLSPLHFFFSDCATYIECSLAFCSGMVLFGALLDCYSVVSRWLLRLKKKKIDASISELSFNHAFISPKQGWVFVLILFIAACGLRFFSFSYQVIGYLFFGTILCSYQMAMIAGKVGLAPLGRFATFVMMPALVLFSTNAMQLVFIATIVEICGGVMVDALFGKKLAQMANISQKKVLVYQCFGLLISASVIGVSFYYMITHYGLGSQSLFAYKAQARHLLINAKQFDYHLLFIGGLFGLVLKRCHVNPGMVLGGLLMPVSSSCMLLLGSSVARLSVAKKNSGDSFWSGVFAGNSLWIVFKSIFF